VNDNQKLTLRIIIAMAIGIGLGIVINLFASDVVWVREYVTGGVLEVGGKAFIACLKLLVVPLVLLSLISGTAALDDIRKVGSVGIKTVVLYLITTAIAISLAIGAGLLFKPGLGIEKEKFISDDNTSRSNVEAELETLSQDVQSLKITVNAVLDALEFEQERLDLTDVPSTQTTTQSIKQAPPFKQVLIDIFPTNPFQSMVQGNMLQIIVFAILFGLAVTLSGAAGKRVLAICDDLLHVVMQLVMLLMQAAPIGVFCLVTRTFAEQGLGAIAPLSKYFGVVLGVLLIHGLITYPLFLHFLARLNPVRFISKLWQAQIFAFSTASSNATIPVTMRTVTQRLGVDSSIASFTVPLGATINMDGTAIMQGVATVFIAQAWGIDLTVSDYLMVIVTATLASIGTAGVPGVGLIMLSMVLLQVGLPVEGIAIILGVDRLLDMVRTAINITGDSMVTCVVGNWHKQIDRSVFDQAN
jgi:Na+/H+-dicarboxylate symporter